MSDRQGAHERRDATDRHQLRAAAGAARKGGSGLMRPFERAEMARFDQPIEPMTLGNMR
jgi:hypothetical protein